MTEDPAPAPGPPPRDTPELTVSMPAFNTAAYIGESVRSALAQQGVDFELIVVDDASSDGTGDIAEAIADPRVRVVRNSRRRGIYWCHNRVLAESRAPFIVHLDSDDLLIQPLAFRKLLDRIQSDTALGMVHAHFVWVDGEGRADRYQFQKMRRFQLQTRVPGRDYRKALLDEGAVINALRLYRAKVLRELGGFNDRMRFGGDYEMGLRMVEHHGIDVVPEALLAVRRHQSNTTRLSFRKFRFWWQRVLLAERLSRSGQISYADHRVYRALRGLARTLRISPPRSAWHGLSKRISPRLRRRLRQTLTGLQRLTIRYMDWLPLRLAAARPAPASSGRCAWYLWQYPEPSQTFVRREIAAVAASGLPVTVFADHRSRGEDAAATAGVPSVFLDELSDADERLRRLRRRRWLRYAWLLVFTACHRYGFQKSFSEDLSLLRRSALLAETLREHGVGHIHVPWADRSAFVAMLASELLGIGYSVQGRAHELHRRQAAFALREKVANAAFVVTNSEYNLRFLRSLAPRGSSDRIHLMYEGVSPQAFPAAEPLNCSGLPLRILCIARFVEEKGLVHLLRACDELRRRGLAFRCNIVGGPERPTYTAYEVTFRSLHRRLQLAPQVTLSGFLPFDRVLEAYRASDLFVLPCVEASNGGKDITPNVLLEAMACGLPVVSTPIGGIPEIVTDGMDGLLVPPGDHQAIADAVQRLAADTGLRARLAAGARRTVVNRFDSSRNVRLLTDLLAARLAPDRAAAPGT